MIADEHSPGGRAVFLGLPGGGPGTQAIERYYSLFNEKDWLGISSMFDLPAVVLVVPRKVLLEKPEAVTAL